MRRLFTAQQLFGEFGTSSADVLTYAAFLENARRQRERDHDWQARLALGGYVVARLVDRLLVLCEQDQEARDAFEWQLEAVQRHIRGLPADAPEAAHLSGIVETIQLGAARSPGLRLGLTAYAYFLEHEGRLEEALDTLGLAARTHGDGIPPTDFATTALFAGRLNRLLARWDAANACYGSAEAAAQMVKDDVTVLRSRLGRGAVMRGQGNLPLARSGAEAVIRDAEKLDLREVLTLAYADLGVVCELQGQWVESVQAHYRAFQTSEDSLQRMRVLGDLGIGLAKIGAYEAAHTAFEIVIASDTSFLVRTNAVLELMDLEAAVGNQMGFERRRAQAEDSRDRMSPSMLADYHYKAGMGQARFGRSRRARVLLLAGLELSEQHQLNAWYFKFEKALNELETDEAHKPKTAPLTAVNLSGSPAVREVAVGLREYALTAP